MLASKLISKEPPEIQELIKKHKKVLQDFPLCIPPQREIKHIVECMLGLKSINMKQYIYIYIYQKNSPRSLVMWHHHEK